MAILIGKLCVILSLFVITAFHPVSTVFGHSIDIKGHKPRIVVLGAGYGGLMTIKKLQKNLDPQEAEVVLVNPSTSHYITTRLHELAADNTTVRSVEVPLPQIINMKKIQFVQDRVKGIDATKQMVYLEEGKPLQYDYLVVGLGSSPETFKIPGMKEHAYFIHNIQSVIPIQKHIRNMFSDYKRTGDKDNLTIVVGGAGLTGIEYIGELVNRIHTLCKELKIPYDKVQIMNVSSSSSILPRFDSELSNYAKKKLEERGVTFISNTRIVACSETEVQLSDGQTIPAKTVIWTGGVRGNRVLENSTFKTERGRIKVDHYLRSVEQKNVFVVGDCALLLDNKNKPYPPTAQIAMEEGKFVGFTLPKVLRGEKVKPFSFKPKGVMASLGDDKGFGMIGSKKIKGFAASMVKEGIEMKWLYQLGGVPLVARKKIVSVLPWLNFMDPMPRVIFGTLLSYEGL